MGPRYRTQLRWIERAGRVLGLSPAVSPRQAERIAEELDLGALEHRPARERFCAARTLRRRGAAVVSVLEQIRLDSSLWPRMLAAGFVGGAWGRPWLWQSRAGRVLSPLSRVGRAVRGPPGRANEMRSSLG